MNVQEDMRNNKSIESGLIWFHHPLCLYPSKSHNTVLRTISFDSNFGHYFAMKSYQTDSMGIYLTILTRIKEQKQRANKCVVRSIYVWLLLGDICTVFGLASVYFCLAENCIGKIIVFTF